MKSVPLAVEPRANLKQHFRQTGQVVVCKSGASYGYKIHWANPSSEGDRNASSEMLINGEAYVCPNGTFTEFWITSEAGIPYAPETIQLRVIDCAQPVVILNPRRFDGFRTHRVGGANVAARTVAQGPLTLYTDLPQAGTADAGDTSRGAIAERGWIAGGISADTPFQAVILQALGLDVTDYFAELARWYVTEADAQAGTRYSCSFEHGGRSAHAAGTATMNGPTLLPWPAYGLRLIINSNGAVDISDLQWLLQSRTGGG